MKRCFALLLALPLALVLCACGRSGTSVRYLDGYNKRIVIDYDAHTISDGENTCTFQGEGRHITLTWPDGGRVTLDGGGLAGDGNHWEESRDFIAALQQDRSSEDGWAVRMLGVAVALLGVFYAVWPERAWRWSYGLWIKNAEPTGLALAVDRGVGVLLIVVGVLMVLFIR